MDQLTLQLEPCTREEMVQALCMVAGNTPHIVVPMWLNRPLPPLGRVRFPWPRSTFSCPVNPPWLQPKPLMEITVQRCSLCDTNPTSGSPAKASFVSRPLDPAN